MDLGIGDYAHLGVLIFFVISGFLITTLLKEEFALQGSISLTGFYARRSLRIFPAAFVYLAVVFTLGRVGVVDVSLRDLVHAVSYSVNFQPSPSHVVVHLWSLSVEEQFYLLWPFAFAVLNPRRAGWVAVAVILIAPLARIADRLFLLDTPFHNLPMFPMVADSLAVGCVLAEWNGRLALRNWYRMIFKPLPSFAMVVGALLIHRYMNRTVGLVLGTSAINVLLAILIHRCLLVQQGVVFRVLNWEPIAWIGGLSYSLYLWQQLFIDRGGVLWMNSFPQNVVLALVAALASLYLVERPLQGLRRRLRERCPSSSNRRKRKRR